MIELKKYDWMKPDEVMMIGAHNTVLINITTGTITEMSNSDIHALVQKRKEGVEVDEKEPTHRSWTCKHCQETKDENEMQYWLMGYNKLDNCCLLCWEVGVDEKKV